MRPFIWHDRLGQHWYVDQGRDTYLAYPGTSWGGYPSLAEAMDAAVSTLVHGAA